MLNLVRLWTQGREGIFERIKGRIDRIAAGTQTEVVTADLPACAEFMQQTTGLKAIPYQTTQSFLNGIVLSGKSSEGQFRSEGCRKTTHSPCHVERRCTGDGVGIARRQH